MGTTQTLQARSADVGDKAKADDLLVLGSAQRP
jgi:hypothetical protein